MPWMISSLLMSPQMTRSGCPNCRGTWLVYAWSDCLVAFLHCVRLPAFLHCVRRQYIHRLLVSRLDAWPADPLSILPSHSRRLQKPTKYPFLHIAQVCLCIHILCIKTSIPLLISSSLSSFLTTIQGNPSHRFDHSLAALAPILTFGQFHWPSWWWGKRQGLGEATSDILTSHRLRWFFPRPCCSTAVARTRRYVTSNHTSTSTLNRQQPIWHCFFSLLPIRAFCSTKFKF